MCHKRITYVSRECSYLTNLAIRLCHLGKVIVFLLFHIPQQNCVRSVDASMRMTSVPDLEVRCVVASCVSPHATHINLQVSCSSDCTVLIWVNIYKRTNVMQLGSMFICQCNIALHVSDAFCVHLQEHLETVEAASGEWHAARNKANINRSIYRLY